MFCRHPGISPAGRLDAEFGDIGIAAKSGIRVALINMEFVAPEFDEALAMAFWLHGAVLLKCHHCGDQPNFLYVPDHLRTGWFSLPSMSEHIVHDVGDVIILNGLQVFHQRRDAICISRITQLCSARLPPDCWRRNRVLWRSPRGVS